MTIIMVTHDDSIADRCERIIRLRDGLVESDTQLRPRSRPAGQSRTPSERTGAPQTPQPFAHG